MSAKKIKQTVLVFLMLVITIVFWWQLTNFFINSYITIYNLIWPGIDIILFFVIFLFFAVLIDAKKIVYPVFLISSFSFFLFFKFNYIYFVSCVILFLSFILAHRAIVREKKDRLRLSLRRIWSRGVPYIVIGISLIIAVVYYFNPLLKINQEKIDIPPRWVALAIKPFGGILGKFLPFYSPNMTIDEMLATSRTTDNLKAGSTSPEILNKLKIKNLENSDINKLIKNSEVSKIIEEERANQVRKMDPNLLVQKRKEFAESLGIELDGNETIDKLIVKILNAKLGKFIGPYSKEISIGIAITLFFFLRLINMILVWLAMAIGSIIFLILNSLKIIQVGKEMREKEVIQI